MAAELQKSFGRISGVLLDLSGTLHVENTPIPAAVSALSRLRKTGLPVRFVTNTTKEPKRLLLSRLLDMGFQVNQDEIFTSLTAARHVVQRSGFRPMLLLEDSAKEDFMGVTCERPNCVVVGLAPSCFNYDHLNKAFKLLLEGGQLIAIHKAKYFKRSDGLALGPGPFVSALEYASGKVAKIVGKPEATFYQSVLSEMNVPATQAVMIGDDVLNDIHGAQVLGMKGILVKTGKYRDGDEDTINPGPHAVCNNFPSAVELILNTAEFNDG